MLKKVFSNNVVKEKVTVTISIDRTTKIFEKYDFFIKLLNKISMFCITNNIKIILPGSSCLLPSCINKNLISLYKPSKRYVYCTDKRPHYVDSNFNFYYCPYYPKRVSSFFIFYK